MIDGFYDARQIADLLDWRASTVREFVAEGSDLLPTPILLGDSKLPYWPAAAVRQWFEAGTPAGWQYDHEEYGRLAWEKFGKVNGGDSEDVDMLYLNQRRMALPNS